MSRSRAQRRAVREDAARQAREAAERQRVATVARGRRRRGLARQWGALTGARRPTSPLRRARARQWAPVLALLFLANAVAWVLWPSSTAHALVAAVSLLCLPLAAVWLADSRSRSGGLG